MMNNEKDEGSTKRSIKLRRLKLVQHCIQSTIAKNENFFKSNFFWSVIVCLLTVTILHKSCEILFLYIFHKPTYHTLMQLSVFSIWNVNPSLEFWCDVTLHNCMSWKSKLVALVAAAEVLWHWYEMKHLNWFLNTQLLHINSLRLSCRNQSLSAFSPSSLQ